MNPIEESFSTCMFSLPNVPYSFLIVAAVKAHLRHHGYKIHAEEDPIMALLEACACITAEMAEGWFRHAGYCQ